MVDIFVALIPIVHKHLALAATVKIQCKMGAMPYFSKA